MARKRTNTCAIEEDKLLAIEVKKFPCLYNKELRTNKEIVTKRNAWSVIENELGYEKGEAEKKFKILKKRYNRKKQDVKKASLLGGDVSDDMSRKKKSLDEYHFIAWLNPYIRNRNLTLNITRQKCKQNEEHNNTANGDEPDVTRATESVDSVAIEIYDENIGKKCKIENVEDICEYNSPNKKNYINMDVEVVVSGNPEKEIHSKNASPTRSSEDDLFGKMIAWELSHFQESSKFQVKHEINDVIYKHRIQQQRQHDERYIYHQHPQRWCRDFVGLDCL